MCCLSLSLAIFPRTMFSVNTVICLALVLFAHPGLCSSPPAKDVALLLCRIAPQLSSPFSSGRRRSGKQGRGLPCAPSLNSRGSSQWVGSSTLEYSFQVQWSFRLTATDFHAGTSIRGATSPGNQGTEPPKEIHSRHGSWAQGCDAIHVKTGGPGSER